jgi:hypothetical protein
MLDTERQKLEKTKQDIMDRLTSGNLPKELEEELRAAIKRVQEQLDRSE